MEVQCATRLMSKCAKYAKACGKPSILMTKPVPNLHINPSEIVADSVNGKVFLSIDKTLNPEFLKSLLKIKGNGIKRVTQIKDEMLKAMGYDPSLVKIIERKSITGHSAAGFAPINGCIAITRKVCDLDNATLIAAIRHELDHLDKFAKTVKSIGVDSYKEMLIENGKINMQGFDTNFWNNISKNCNTTGFDKNRYLDAVKNYFKKHDDPIINKISYYNNDLEKSAYTIQSKVNSVLSPGSATVREVFPCGFKNIEYMLSNTKFPPEERYKQLRILLEEKRIENDPRINQLLESITKKPRITLLDRIRLMKIQKILNSSNLTREQYQKYYEQINNDLAKQCSK